MSITSKEALGGDDLLASSTIPGARSTPTTSPPGVTSAARTRVSVPGPQARSMIRIPGCAPTSSIRRRRLLDSRRDMMLSSRF